MTKSAFDQTPNLTETFDQVQRSSEIRSSECFPSHSESTQKRPTAIKIFQWSDKGVCRSKNLKELSRIKLSSLSLLLPFKESFIPNRLKNDRLLSNVNNSFDN